MTIELKNTVYADIDSFGNFRDEWTCLGFVNYGKGKPYYAYDEVEEMIKSGEIDGDIFYRDDYGKLLLKESLCSACTCFKIVCGKIIHETKYDNLVEYARKIGLISDDFRVVKGWFGDKLIKENNGLYDMTYTFTKSYPRMNINFAEKICVGAIKKLAGRRKKSSSKDGTVSKKIFECSDVYFDKEARVLNIIGIPKEYICEDITGVIRNLDLELWMIFNEDKYWSRFFTSAVDAVRDFGQYQWLDRLHENTMEGNKKRSNYDWFDKELGKEWE